MAHTKGPLVYDLFRTENPGFRCATVRATRELQAGCLICLDGKIYRVIGVDQAVGVASMKDSKVAEREFAIDVSRLP